MNSKTVWIALNVVLGLGSVACRPSAEDSQTKIFGGTSAGARWPSAVALLTYQSADCSGVLIHPRLVVTAAHCVEDADESLEVYMGAGDDEAPLQGQGTVERIVASPFFGADPKGFHDIAYIALKEPMPIVAEDIMPILSSSVETSTALQAGRTVKIVGFGLRENEVYGSKFEADVSITGVQETEVRMGGKGVDACGGDSGGPAYLPLADGQWRVFGVASRGGACGKGGVWTRVDAHACWIQRDSGIDLNLPLGTCKDSVLD